MAVEYRVEKAPDNSDLGVGLFVEFERSECLVKGDDLGGLIFCVCFKTGSYYVTLAVLELCKTVLELKEILLHLTPKCWD